MKDQSTHRSQNKLVMARAQLPGSLDSQAGLCAHHIGFYAPNTKCQLDSTALSC